MTFVFNDFNCWPSPFKTPTGHVTHQQFNIQQLYALPHTVFICFVFIWEQTATCATYSINVLVFITEMESVYSAVRSGSLNKATCATYSINLLVFITQMKSVYSAVRTGSLNKANCATYNINWLVFIAEMKSVYSAVRTGSLNRAVCASSLNGLIFKVEHLLVTTIVTYITPTGHCLSKSHLTLWWAAWGSCFMNFMLRISYPSSSCIVESPL